MDPDPHCSSCTTASPPALSLTTQVIMPLSYAWHVKRSLSSNLYIHSRSIFILHPFHSNNSYIMIAFTNLFVSLALALPLVSAHGVLLGVTGTNNKNGTGFAVIPSVPRNGTAQFPFQVDTAIIRDQEIAQGKAGVCGRTILGGSTDVATKLAIAAFSGLPAAGADGTVTMTLHQINGDGAGPYTCEVSANGSGTDFVNATVTTNVPGVKGLSKTGAFTDFPLIAQIPAGIKCTGGPLGNACIMRCRNPIGPFGGCVAVGQGDATAGVASGAVVAAAVSRRAAACKRNTAVETPEMEKRNLISRVVGNKNRGMWI